MDIVENLIKNINILGFTLIFVAFLFGIKLPDWDFKLGLRHRSIITHSPFITLLLIFIYRVKADFFFKYFIVGFSIAIAVHILFDLFPYKWQGGALLKIPINISCDENITKLFFVMTIIINIFIGIFYMTDIYEYIFILILAILTFIKKTRAERIFIRPFLIFIFLVGGLGSLKFRIIFNFLKNLLGKIV
ncbi:MAG: hypothetical protein Q4A58_06515 [Fusobacterium sp.]|uniref:hypothetical protein n=1 Tax=Fusobacterium sp. TaxID=68766 RepID=UPI0026DAF49F|nr:hypothetical protein [Fusobacterium sp.]MDO4690928.1 hypothetical protein [Fusobacterium sp.]